MPATIGERIKELREKNEWSQRELADRVGINYSVVNRIELDKRPVKDHEISKFADIFGVNTDYLIGKSTNKINKQEDTFNPLAIIKEHLEKKGGAEQFGFFNIDEWKDLTPEQVEDFLEDIDYMFQKAKKRNEEKE